MSVQQDERNIAGGLALSVLATLLDEANNISLCLVNEATTEDVLSLLNGVLTAVETAAKNFQNLTSNFETLCNSLNEGE